MPATAVRASAMRAGGMPASNAPLAKTALSPQQNAATTTASVASGTARRAASVSVRRRFHGARCYPPRAGAAAGAGAPTRH